MYVNCCAYQQTLSRKIIHVRNIFVSFPEHSVETIMCGVTTVRLVSSGQFHNAVTVAVTPTDGETTPTLVCGQ